MFLVHPVCCLLFVVVVVVDVRVVIDVGVVDPFVVVFVLPNLFVVISVLFLQRVCCWYVCPTCWLVSLLYYVVVNLYVVVVRFFIYATRLLLVCLSKRLVVATVLSFLFVGIVVNVVFFWVQRADNIRSGLFLNNLPRSTITLTFWNSSYNSVQNAPNHCPYKENRTN